MSEVKGGPERSVPPPVKAGAENAAGSSAAQAEPQGWTPDTSPVTGPQRTSKLRARHRVAAAVVLAGAVSGVALANQDNGQNAQVTSGDTNYTRTVDGGAMASPLDLANGTFSIGTHAENPTVEAQVQRVNAEAPLQTPPAPPPPVEDHIEQHDVEHGDTLSRLARQAIIDATDIKKPASDITLEVTTVAGALTPGIDNLDKIGYAANEHDDVVNLPDKGTIQRIVAANQGEDGSPEVNAAVKTLHEAITSEGYKNVGDEARAVVEALDLEVPTVPANADANQGGQEQQDAKPFNGVEPLGPTIPDGERATYIQDAEQFGVIVQTELTGPNISKQQKEAYDLNKAATNITARLAVQFSEDHPDAAVNQEGKFDEHSMHHGEKFAELNPLLVPVVEGIASLSSEQMAEIQKNPAVTPEAFQALLTIWNVDHTGGNNEAIVNRDQAAADVTLRIASTLDVTDLDNNPELKALLGELQGKSPKDAAALLAQKAPEFAAQFLDTAFPHVDPNGGGGGGGGAAQAETVSVPGANGPVELTIPDSILSITDPAAKAEALRVFADQQGNIIAQGFEDAGKTFDANAIDEGIATVLEQKLGVTIPEVHPAPPVDAGKVEVVTVLGPREIHIPANILAMTDKAAQAEALKGFADQIGDTLTKELQDAGKTVDGNLIDEDVARAIENALKVTIPEIHPAPPAEDTTATKAPAATETSAPATSPAAAPAEDGTPGTQQPDHGADWTIPLVAGGGILGLLGAAGGFLGVRRAREASRYNRLRAVDVPAKELPLAAYTAAINRVKNNALTPTSELDPANLVAGQEYPINTMYTRSTAELKKILMDLSVPAAEADAIVAEQNARLTASRGPRSGHLRARRESDVVFRVKNQELPNPRHGGTGTVEVPKVDVVAVRRP